MLRRYSAWGVRGVDTLGSPAIDLYTVWAYGQLVGTEVQKAPVNFHWHTAGGCSAALSLHCPLSLQSFLLRL